MPLDLRPARATARANIALAKYWGKSDITHNLPAVPSISLTLEELGKSHCRRTGTFVWSLPSPRPDWP